MVGGGGCHVKIRKYIVTINVEKNSCNMIIYSDRNLFTEVIYRRNLQIYYVICGKMCDSQ